MWGVCDLACVALTYGAAFILLPLLLGLPQVSKKKPRRRLVDGAIGMCTYAGGLAPLPPLAPLTPSLPKQSQGAPDPYSRTQQ